MKQQEPMKVDKRTIKDLKNEEIVLLKSSNNERHCRVERFIDRFNIARVTPTYFDGVVALEDQEGEWKRLYENEKDFDWYAMRSYTKRDYAKWLFHREAHEVEDPDKKEIEIPDKYFDDFEFQKRKKKQEQKKKIKDKKIEAIIVEIVQSSKRIGALAQKERHQEAISNLMGNIDYKKSDEDIPLKQQRHYDRIEELIEQLNNLINNK